MALYECFQGPSTSIVPNRGLTQLPLKIITYPQKLAPMVFAVYWLIRSTSPLPQANILTDTSSAVWNEAKESLWGRTWLGWCATLLFTLLILQAKFCDDLFPLADQFVPFLSSKPIFSFAAKLHATTPPGPRQGPLIRTLLALLHRRGSHPPGFDKFMADEAAETKLDHAPFLNLPLGSDSHIPSETDVEYGGKEPFEEDSGVGGIQARLEEGSIEMDVQTTEGRKSSSSSLKLDEPGWSKSSSPSIEMEMDDAWRKMGSASVDSGKTMVEPKGEQEGEVEGSHEERDLGESKVEKS